jgi:hypothetical protein
MAGSGGVAGCCKLLCRHRLLELDGAPFREKQQACYQATFVGRWPSWTAARQTALPHPANLALSILPDIYMLSL